MGGRSILIAAVSGACLFALGHTPASASTVVFQCAEAVCAVDPDTGEKPRQLAPAGRVAGVTRDGVTASWVDPSGALVKAPVAGGAPAPIGFNGSVVNQPLMSPDGSRYLWWYNGPDGFGGLNAVWVRRLTVGAAESEGVGFCSYCVISHGWLGNTAIGALPADTRPGEPSKVCTMASPAEAPQVSGTCVAPIAADTRGGVGFPGANAAGTELVAVLTPGEGTGIKGRIVRYSLANGAAMGDVTAGTTDTTPVFSPEGDRVAFDRDGQIVIKDLTGAGTERVLAAGSYPHWGGARTVVGPALRSSSLRYRGGKIAVRVACTGTATCRGTLRIKRGKTTVGSRAYRVAGGRSGTVTVKPSRRGGRALGSRRSQTVSVQLKPSTGEAVTKSLKLRR
ncbi:hypothetical protein DVA67_007455 [Solirubrobacter sp. CPCC 204708]|uniref:Uncharacterized protein n=1 Tax=Solirubrobacter deserti TaxID=2282478 RepID=A0ABT4RK14_9ACTN|nr:hypothetical protein [Solirubrobacter deserti]MBE2315807.1 hypothetical protein [Solirubrobacter deserti]MDA0138857.1 hypothetical protein [Solirubrobacter deserti]